MKEVVKQVKDLQLGDLVRVDWFDASIGKSLSGKRTNIKASEIYQFTNFSNIIRMLVSQ